MSTAQVVETVCGHLWEQLKLLFAEKANYHWLNGGYLVSTLLHAIRNRLVIASRRLPGMGWAKWTWTFGTGRELTGWEKNVHFYFRRHSAYRSTDCFEIWARFESSDVRKSGSAGMQEILLMESGIQLKESRILLTTGTGSGIQVPLRKTGIHHLESGIHGVESRIQDCLGFPYMERFE